MNGEEGVRRMSGARARAGEGLKEAGAGPRYAREEPGEATVLQLLEELKADRAELRRLLDKYRRAIEISLDAMVAVDEDGVITLWNPAAEKFFGYSSDEALGTNVEMLVPPGLRERHRRGKERFLSTGQGSIIGHVVEVEGICKDGSLMPLEMSLSAEKVDGRWVFMAILRDSAARRKLEEELKTRLVEVERLARFMVGRELKMEDLRREIAVFKKNSAEKA